MKGASGPRLRPCTRKSEKRPAVIAMRLLAAVTMASVEGMESAGRSRDLCSETYQHSNTEYRQEVETPLRILPARRT